jgi:ubiquinone biosynthesis protein
MSRWKSFQRALTIIAVLVRHLIAYLGRKRLSRWNWSRKYLPDGSRPAPERFRMLLEDLGGAFVKLGQMLALQPDIVRIEYCNALFDLLDRVSPFEYEHVERTFVEDLGRKPTEIFDSFERKPLATASIGQVHVAYLAGRKFAVKVRRPNVECEFLGDIRLMSTCLWLVERLRLERCYWLSEPIREFVRWTHEELDYHNEARYMQELRRNAQTHPVERIPEVMSELTTHRILVSEFLDGFTFLDCIRHKCHADFEPNQVARNVIDNFLGDAFRYGIFHADLHPANLMVLDRNVVGYVDFGITGLLSSYSRHNLAALTMAYTSGDLDGISNAFFRVSTLGPQSDPKAFREGLKKLEPEWYEEHGRKRRLRKTFTQVMLDMLTLSRRTSIFPEKDVIKYIRSAIAIDGLMNRFAPHFNVGAYLEEACTRFLRTEGLGWLLSYERLIGTSTITSRLMRTALFRIPHWIQQVSTASVSFKERSHRFSKPGALEIYGRPFSVAVFVSACVINVNNHSLQPGLSLIRAEVALALMLCSAGLLLWSVRRLHDRIGNKGGNVLYDS